LFSNGFNRALTAQANRVPDASSAVNRSRLSAQTPLSHAMAIHDASSQRLYVDADLSSGARFPASPEQANYLLNVLRARAGDTVRLFNGRNGEWTAAIADVSKRGCTLALAHQTRPQAVGPDIDYLFAPLKRARLDYMVQKAAEMGVRRLRPLITRHTVAERVNLDRLRANAIEAAEQCGVLWVPEVLEPVKFEAALTGWDTGRTLIFADEDALVANPIDTLRRVPKGPIAVLIGPEGGFHTEERALLRIQSFTVPLSLGPRIMRADTAAVAALALVNAVLGDWS
jgi:16S rRNA (uracil1498-N3)-methyltransferase